MTFTWAERLVLALIAILCTTFAPSGHAGELSRETATLAYMLAHSVSGYKLPDQAPDIHLVPVEHLRQAVCPKKECTVHGFQIENRVYLDEALDMDDPYNRAILFHELVHYLQWANKGDAKDCPEWIEREQEAYSLQRHVLQKVGLRLVIPILPTCS